VISPGGRRAGSSDQEPLAAADRVHRGAAPGSVVWPPLLQRPPRPGGV